MSLLKFSFSHLQTFWLYESISLLKVGLKQLKKARMEKEKDAEKDKKKKKE